MIYIDFRKKMVVEPPSPRFTKRLRVVDVTFTKSMLCALVDVLLWLKLTSPGSKIRRRILHLKMFEGDIPIETFSSFFGGLSQLAMLDNRRVDEKSGLHFPLAVSSSQGTMNEGSRKSFSGKSDLGCSPNHLIMSELITLDFTMI